MKILILNFGRLCNTQSPYQPIPSMFYEHCQFLALGIEHSVQNEFLRWTVRLALDDLAGCFEVRRQDELLAELIVACPGRGPEAWTRVMRRMEGYQGSDLGLKDSATWHRPETSRWAAVFFHRPYCYLTVNERTCLGHYLSTMAEVFASPTDLILGPFSRN